MRRPPQSDRPLSERIASVWRNPAGGTRTRPVFVASLCAGVVGFTLARVLHLNVLVAYVLTVIAVFAVTTAVLVWREP